MINRNRTVLALAVFALVASGCSGRDEGEPTDAQLPNDGNSDGPIVIEVPMNTDTGDGPIVIEVPMNTDTSDGDATPVAEISSFEMDKYVINPLLTAIPSELTGGSNAPRRHVSNPLMN